MQVSMEKQTIIYRLLQTANTFRRHLKLPRVEIILQGHLKANFL